MRVRYFGAMVVWCVLLLFSLILTWKSNYRVAVELASEVANSHFNKDLAYRRWATLHGGVYVIPTSEYPPNPYLSWMSNRDIQTTDGKLLTLINPAYMTRQVFELSQEQYGVRAHITSLSPIRPENKPDEWEKASLHAFESGIMEVSSVESIEGKSYLRYMRPMMVEEGCLKCHGYQDYDVGDVRGGISVSVPFMPYVESAKEQFNRALLLHLTVGCLGVLGIWRFGRFEFHSQEELREREQRLSFAMEASQIAPWDWNLHTQEVFYSPAWKRQIGYEEDEIPHLLEEWEKRLHSEDHDRVISIFNDFREGRKGVYDVIFRFQHKDGSYRWIESKAVLTKDKDGSPHRIYGCHLDITERKKSEDAVRRTALEWSAATDASNDALYILDVDRHLLRANKVFYMMTGRSPETSVGLHIENIIHGEKEAVPCPVCLAQIEMRDAVIRMEPDDPNNPTGKPIEIIITIVRDDTGQPMSIFMRLQDLSAQREIEDTLRKSQEQWEKTFNAISDVIVIQDADMKIIKANQAASEMLSTDESIIGQYCYELFADLDQPCPGCPALDSQDTLRSYTKEIVHEKLGKTFQVSGAPVIDADQNMTHTVHIAKDVTESKKIEADLRQAQKMEAIGTLAGGIAHDFNNILTSIIGYAELAKAGVPPESETAKDVEQILVASDRATDLVSHILSFSRKAEYALQPLAPHIILKEALKMMRATFPASIDIMEVIDNNCGRIMADPTSFHQIIINLCTNALHSMEKEKGILSVKLYSKDVSEEDVVGEQGVSSGPFVVLEVKDTGHGIEPKVLERIFDPYFTTKKDGKGTGLGLAVIHGKVKDFKGFIRVESRVGVGSTFSIFLPVMKTEAHQDTMLMSEDSLPTGTESILVVDDEEAIGRVVQLILEKLGYEVITATDGWSALRIIRDNSEQIDLVITDQTMPKMTGSELAEEILRIKPDMPIILCTGYSSVLSKEDAFAIGIRKYVKKPLRRKVLAETCRELLDNR